MPRSRSPVREDLRSRMSQPSKRSPSPSRRRRAAARTANSPSPSPSPSPPRKRAAPSRLKVTTGGGGKRHIKEEYEEDEVEEAAPEHPAKGSKTRGPGGKYIFGGPEFGLVDVKEQKKIQIDIRRNIPAHKISDSPIRRNIQDPSKVAVSRRKDEGQKPVFDRDEINSWTAPDSEKRSVNLLRDKDVSDRRRQQPERERQDVRDRSPLGRADRMASSRDQQRTSVKDRLGVAAGGDRKSTGQVRDRLGEREGVLEDTERMLDREEMESRRPNTRPWDINPEYVPRGRNYYEHDNRDAFDGGSFDNRRRRGFRGDGWRGSFRSDFSDRRDRNGSWRDGGERGFRDNERGGWRGSYRGRGFRGGYKRRDSPVWKHDLFEEQEQEEPSSTTNE